MRTRIQQAASDRADSVHRLGTKAYSLREHASEREKFDIESMYYSDVTGDLQSTIRVFREWLASYPHDNTALGNLANTYSDLGDYEQAADLARQALELSPNDVDGYDNLAAFLMMLGHFAESRKIIQQAFDRNLDDALLHYLLYNLAFLSGDERGMAQQVAWSEGTPEALPVLLLLQSSKEAYNGHVKNARELNRRAVASLERSSRKERATLERMSAALREVALGNLAEARHDVISTLGQPSVGQGPEEDRALIFAWLGEIARAESLVEDLAKQSPTGTIMQSVTLPTIRAEIELSKKNPERSIELLRAAAPYELTWGTFTAVYEVCIYPAYVRGEAYLAAKQGIPAAAEFQKILDHRGLVRSCETGALAHLGLARAYVLEGDTARARAAYQDFLTLWKDPDPDPDIPILKEAKAEYAKLQ